MITFVTIPEEKWKIVKRRKDWIKKIEDITGVKIEANKNQEIKIEGEDPVSVLRTKEIVRALGRGFDFQTALNLLDEEYFLEVIELKQFSKSRNRQMELKGRVIGSEGVVKRKIEEATETKIAVHGKTISIIGKWKNTRIAKQAIEMLLSGVMHNTVYRFLERQKL